MITRIDELSELSETDFAFWIFSKNKKSFKYISPGVQNIFETHIKKISDINTFRKVVHRDDQIKVIRNLNGGNFDSANELDYRIITPTGEIKWLTNISIGVKDNKNKITTVIGCTYVKPNNLPVSSIKNTDINDKAVLKSIPDSFIIVSEKGKILNENIHENEASILLDINEQNRLEKNISAVLNKELYKEIESKITELRTNKRSFSFECELQTINDSEWFEVRIIKMRSDAFLVIIRNNTKTFLRMNKIQKFFEIAEQSQELIMITDVNGVIEYVNPMISKTSGYSYDELVGNKPSLLKSGKHDAIFFSELWNTILDGKPFKAEFFNHKKNGEYFIEEKIITPFSNINGNITNFISTGRDVTEERKKESKENKYKQLETTIHEKEQKTRTLSLIKSNEIERKQFAQEIHEGLSQMLSVAMVNLDKLLAQKVISLEEKNKIEFINHMVSEIIQELRGLSINLSPISLYEFGLHPVIQQLAQKIDRQNKSINIAFSSNIEGFRFKNEVEINLYRIIQEALANVVKHSNATEISLAISYNNGNLTLAIMDNGQGININNLEFKKMNAHGILNIEARAKSIGGSLNITSHKGMGFSIELSINTKKI